LKEREEEMFSGSKSNDKMKKERKERKEKHNARSVLKETINFDTRQQIEKESV